MNTQDNTPPDLRIARLAERQHGQVSTRQLRACGLDSQAIARRVRTGRLHPVFRGVYAVGHRALTQQGRFMAAVLACGRAAALSHHSAGVSYAYLAQEMRRPEVTVSRSSAPTVTGIRVHRARSLDARDVVVHAGVTTTSPARTLLDLAVVLSAPALRRAVRRAEANRLVTVGELLALIDRTRGHHGGGALRAAVATDPAPTRSELEDRVLDLLDAAGIERPMVNVPLRLGGRTIIPDFLWPDRRLVLEADGAAWHDHRLAREDDAARQAILEAAGYHVLRITWGQALRQADQTIARVRAAMRAPADQRQRA